MLQKNKGKIMNKPFKNRHLLQWCKQLFPIGLLSLSGIFTLQTITSAVPSNAQLQDWRFSPENGLLEFTLSNATQPKYFYLSQPPRLVVDLPSTKLGSVPTQQNYSGTIQRIRLSQLNTNVTRIVMDLTPGTAFNPNQVQLQPASPNNPTRWVLRPFLTNYTNNPGFPPIYQPQPTNLPPISYPVQQPNYPLQQPNYPVQQPNYPIQQPNYPVQQPNYPIQQPNYPIQQPNYPIQQPNYPIQQPNYPIQQPNYPVQQPNYPIQQPNFPPLGNTQTLPNVSVPPLTPNNPSQTGGSMLPPASFSTPLGGVNNNVPPVMSPSFPAPTNNPINNNPGSGVVNWGQSLPTIPQ
jgi:hypothetical protein